MKTLLKTLVLTLLSGSAIAQARLVLDSNPFIVLNGGTSGTPINIVLDNSAANAITWTGTPQASGGIISEADYNRVVWNVQNATGATYSVPFTKSSTGPAIPFDVAITSAGTQVTKGSLRLSTYATANNNTPFANGVTNVNSATAGGNNSLKTIDRFWLIEANDYTTKPAATIALTYVDAEHGGTNTITESNLRAQRYDAVNNDWDGFAATGTINTVTNRIDAIAITPTEFYRPWTLTDRTSVLPIELTEFKADCANGQRNLYWITASETNNNYFTIEKSVDGITFIEIGVIASLALSGNSTSSLSYNYIDKNNVLGDYYRLKQTDYDGKFEYSSVIYNKCDDDAIKPSSFDVYPNPSNGMVNVLLTGYDNQPIQITIINAMGQKVAERKVQGEVTTQKETFSLMELPKGMYYVTIIAEKETITKRVINQY